MEMQQVTEVLQKDGIHRLEGRDYLLFNITIMAVDGLATQGISNSGIDLVLPKYFSLTHSSQGMWIFFQMCKFQMLCCDYFRSIYSAIAFRWNAQDPTDDKSTYWSM